MINTLKLIFFSLVLLSSTLIFAQSEEQWKTLEQENYALSYPEDWTLDQNGLMGTELFLFSPLLSEVDDFKDNFSLMIQDLTGMEIDLEKYVEISVGQIKTMITDNNILKNERIAKSDNTPIEFQRIEYTGKQGIYNLHLVQYYLVVDDIAYVLTLTCEIESYAEHKEVGEKILQSFVLR